MRRNASLGAYQVALLLDRSVSSVYCKAHELRISLRRPGSRAGRRIGIPASMRLSDLGNVPASAIQSGKFDIATAELAIVSERTAPLCPACSIYPVQVRTTGLCRLCHLRHLIAKYHESALVDDANRELQRARTDKSRARVCANCAVTFRPRKTSTATLCPECEEAMS